MDDEIKLIVPENCPPVRYVVGGFMQNDVICILIIGVISVIAGIAVYQTNGNSIMALAIVLFSLIIAVSVFRRDRYTENLFDKVRIIRKYRKAQKHYEYKYVDIWELETWEWMRY